MSVILPARADEFCPAKVLNARSRSQWISALDGALWWSPGHCRSL